MLLHRVTFYPNDRVEAERLDLDELDPATLEPFQPLFAQGPCFDSPVPCDLGDLRVKWTGAATGQALFSCSLNKQLFLSGAAAAGLNAEADTEILRMYTASLAATPRIWEITGIEPDTFTVNLNRPERPLLASVVIPTLPIETFEQI